MNNSNNLMRAHREWANRPDDERYLSLDALLAYTEDRKQRSNTFFSSDDVQVSADNGAVTLQHLSDGNQYRMNHWSFGQLCQRFKAPADYLRKLPAEVAQINLDYHLKFDADMKGAMFLVDEGEPEVFNGKPAYLRATTSAQYGRVYDADVVKMIKKLTNYGNWKIPAASYEKADPKRATTLYASDRDVFAFLVDETNPIEVPGMNGRDVLFRGFYAWNSEVGAASFGMTTFLYRYVCDNRIIWGAENVRTLTFRHQANAVDRFIDEAAPTLRLYAASGVQKTVSKVIAARAKSLGSGDDDVVSWLRARKFTDVIAKKAVVLAEQEPGDKRSLWNVVQGLTAAAKSIPHQDARVDLEQRAGALLNIVN